NEKIIKRCDDLKYLGLNFKAGNKLIVNMEHAKLNFYRAFNALYSKCHAVNSEITCVFLLESICLPFLMYSIEAKAPDNNMFKSIDKMVDICLQKYLLLTTARLLKIVELLL